MNKKDLMNILKFVPDDAEINFLLDGKEVDFIGKHYDDVLHETTSKTKAKYVHIYLHKDGSELVKSETLEKLEKQDIKSILESNKDKIYLNMPDDSVNRTRLSEVKIYGDSILLHSYGYTSKHL